MLCNVFKSKLRSAYHEAACNNGHRTLLLLNILVTFLAVLSPALEIARIVLIVFTVTQPKNISKLIQSIQSRNCDFMGNKERKHFSKF